MNIAIYGQREYGGTGLYRLHMPHELMSDWGHKILFTDSLNVDDYLDYDIFIASKSWFLPARQLVYKLKVRGIITIIDFDDYWVLPQSHILYKDYKKHDTSKLLIGALELFDYVTCTTPLLRDAIRQINPRVEVFENAVNPNLQQFVVDCPKTENIRFGWVGGHCHGVDIALLDGTPQKLQGKFNINLFGYDRKVGSVYEEFAEILSGRRSLVFREPKQFFLYDGKSAREYTQFYNHFDVALAPLVDDKFNSMKSELKMVEAGFMRKACIVSDVYPYRYVINDKNCLTVVHKQHWAKRMQKLINNPSMTYDLAEALYESVKDKYHIETVTKRREQWYDGLRPL